MSAITYISAAQVAHALSPAAAVGVVRDALRRGHDPASDLARIAVPLDGGEFLLMPSQTPSSTGIKVLTVAPGNPAVGLPRIQGLYLLFAASALTPRALIDGPALTDLRTAAVSIAAVHDLLAARPDPLHVVIYGAGHQGAAHLHTLVDAFGPVASATAVVRAPQNVVSPHPFTAVIEAGSAAAQEATMRADLIVCATTAREPLFAADLVSDHSVVIAVGSHEPDARELPGELMARADVVVEDVATALRECGDVVMAVNEGALAAERLLPLRDVVSGAASFSGSRPVVFKSSGMSWEDLVLAEAIVRAHLTPENRA